jgi:hypothetical protein
VPVLAPDSAEAQRIDAALATWRQGDLALDERWFIHAGDGAVPLTEAAAESGDAGLQALASEVAGLAVLTQTCDVVRRCVERPYVEVAPLVSVDVDTLADVRRGRRPALATLPGLVASDLVVDLDRVMTVEKSLVASWTRTPGYATDADGRAFAQALARKRVRVAFPDDFNALAKKLQRRLGDKHEKNTDEGRGLRALRELRVQAAPAWDAAAVALMFWFVRHDDNADFEGRSWADLLAAWLTLVQPSGRFVEIEGQVVTLAEMTGADYVASDPLDLDHLSKPATPTRGSI